MAEANLEDARSRVHYATKRTTKEAEKVACPLLNELPEFADVTGDPGDNIEAVEALIRSHGIELVYELIPCGADGISKKGTIVIAPDLHPAARLATLVHEVSHEFMHQSSERRKETTKTIRETEAEAVSHVVCQPLGLETLEHSVDYIQLYNGDVEVLAKSMDHIQKTAAKILVGIQAHASQSIGSDEVAA